MHVHCAKPYPGVHLLELQHHADMLRVKVTSLLGTQKYTALF